MSGGDDNTPVGALKGKFTINSNGDQVYFSKGNLQYIGSAATPYWKFADSQLQYLGTSTGQNSGNIDVDRDLFGFGTSGYDHGAVCYQPWSTSTTNSDYYAYGDRTKKLTDSTGKANWGYNAIANGGNQENIGWRCLLSTEFVYIIYTRNTQSGIRYAKVNIGGVKGLAILPDDWNESYHTFTNANTNGDFVDVMTQSQWNDIESHGAVLMPLPGSRGGASMNSGYLNTYGWYWCNNVYNNNAYFIDIRKNALQTSQTGRYVGYAVRLVKDIIE